ncbi:MAG TPA: hypothetical protein DDW45_07800, partial [Gammaproteobacteria bacterium]|nr:hypothetical protein [Gammaproteobacteria bacterium]
MKSDHLKTCSILFGASLLFAPATTMSADAIQTTGVPGSPSATTTIEGNQLPPMPDEKFGGKIERNVQQSKPYWPPRVVPPKG